MVGEEFGERADSAPGISGLPVPSGQVVAGDEGMGVVGPEESETIGEEFGQNIDRASWISSLSLASSDVFAGGEGVGVVGSEDP
ncbi:hypothetical protein AWI43_30950 [Streptomyces sp. WAC04657]|nr:hypothetical protein AWI43_30950 [Streptomyces sp. WAC04657]